MKYLFSNYFCHVYALIIQKMRISLLFLLGQCLLVLIMLSSCGTTQDNKLMRVVKSDSLAQEHGFTRKLVKGGDFWITTYQKLQNKNMPYVFYIEGDGHAFEGRYAVSNDPTPTNPILLKLATLDKRDNVVYIARPCQYTPMDINHKCNASYWTNKRMSDEVISSINEVIETINPTDAPFSLVGYSGGGGIAVLVAARNNMVKDIITIAGNLDHIAFNQHHNTPPMVGSLNPIDEASAIKNIPQLHLSGMHDKVVPVFIADAYVRKSGSECVHQHIFDATHSKKWERIWPYVLSTMPVSCYKY